MAPFGHCVELGEVASTILANACAIISRIGVDPSATLCRAASQNGSL